MVREDFRQIVDQYNGVTFLTVAQSSFRSAIVNQFSPLPLLSGSDLENLFLKLAASNAYL